MNVAVIGSRTFTDYKKMKETLDNIKGITKIISGGASGADKLAERYAKENNIETLIFKPDWAKFGRGAGVIRNEDIIANCDKVVAFWDGKSKGTLSSLKIAKEKKRSIEIVLNL